MRGMFEGCSTLKNIKFNSKFNFDISSDVLSMFDGCPDELIIEIRKKFKNIDKNAFVHVIHYDYDVY